MKPFFDAKAYLARIGLTHPISVSIAGLEQIHRAQVYSIPFENFDVLQGKKIDLAPAALMKKLVSNQRGGYCFEVNGLLFLALKYFGFKVRPLLARVHLGGETTGRHHLVILVTLNGQDWIADAGFGAHGFRTPLKLKLLEEVDQEGVIFRMLDYGQFGTLLQVNERGEWLNAYSFDHSFVCPADIETGNHYTSTHPDSFFKSCQVASKLTPDGRISLLDNQLRHIKGEQEIVQELKPANYFSALQQHFGIHLNASLESIKPVNKTTERFILD